MPSPAVPPPAAAMEVAESFGYATMGERFAAFLIDASIETALVAAFFILSSGSSTLKDFEDLCAAAIPVAYMAFTEFLLHGTLGKRLLGIQVRTDSPQLAYPSLFQLLLRESVGKFVSSLVLGIGFLVGFRNPKTKTWADSMAGTVVVKSRVAGRFRGWVLPAVICIYFAWPMVWKEISSRYQSALSDRMIATENSIDDLHAKIFRAFFNDQRWRADEPEQAKLYQQQMSTLRPALDEYTRLLAREEEQITQLSTVIDPRNSDVAGKADAYGNVIPLRQEIAGLVRQHVQKALDSGPQQPAWNALLEDRQKTMRAINAKNDEINRIARNYIPHTVQFQEHFE